MKTANRPHVFGIRHHGPGSARSLLTALEALQPDIILVEGPPDGDKLLPLITHGEMRPPIALLIYDPKAPQRSVYYPFAQFSPEWQALQFGLTRQIPVQFMDLPQTHQIALAATEPTSTAPPAGPDSPPAEPGIHDDPLHWLAQAAGYEDGERWWEDMVEQRRDSSDLFTAILTAMTALRQTAAEEELGTPLSQPALRHREGLREAHMRKIIRTAQRRGHKKIAVVCGAWHAPALAELPPAKYDNAMLKGLPKIKLNATWIPWTYQRLALSSGYGAGIESPGWYHHLWAAGDEVVMHWLTQVAHLLRNAGLDASSAQIIDAVRLAETLAALRNRPLPGLPELTEAAQAIFCFGQETPLRLIKEQLIIGNRLGNVPPETPLIPLQQDLQQQQKSFRLKPNAEAHPLELDLRRPLDLSRSHLLHRLNLLGIPWGEQRRVRGKLGSFHEHWQLRWDPEFAIRLIEAGVYGNTIREAALDFAQEKADDLSAGATDQPILPALTHLLNQALLADLPEAIHQLLISLRTEAALASDIAHLMEALPPLATITRYSNVRQTDTQLVAKVVDGLVARICIGLPAACASLNDEAAAAMVERLMQVNSAVSLLQNESHRQAWQAVLNRLADGDRLHGLVSGRCCRLLHDAQALSGEAVAKRLRLALGAANAPTHIAAWIEGFLTNSGLLLLHDATLRQLLDDWLTQLTETDFRQVLPLLRRTFATFSSAERRRLGEQIQHPSSEASRSPPPFNPENAAQVLPLVRQILGLEQSKG